MATAFVPATSTSSSDAGPQNWSDLPEDLLHSILLCLYHTRDLLAFSSVCRSWRSFAKFTLAAFRTSLFPPLLIFFDLKRRRHRHQRRTIPSSVRLHDFTTKTFNQSPVEESILSIPFLCCSHGHLLFLTRRRQILLVNIFTGFQITSPVFPLDHHPRSSSSCLALLTASISSQNCTLIFLTFDKLFLWKINSPDWFYRPLRVRLTKLRQMMVVGSRILVVGRKVWAFEFWNMLSIKEFPLYLCPKELVVQCRTQNILPSFEYSQIVDCDGEILYVCFTPTDTQFKVEVFHVDMLDDHMILVDKNNLGNQALFLSKAVNDLGCVCNNPERWGGKNNSIYYANDDRYYRFEVGGFVSPYTLYQELSEAKGFNSFWHYASILQ